LASFCWRYNADAGVRIPDFHRLSLAAFSRHEDGRVIVRSVDPFAAKEFIPVKKIEMIFCHVSPPRVVRTLRLFIDSRINLI
jgi:hypothetical protein